jgi:hypothetical protein
VRIFPPERELKNPIELEKSTELKLNLDNFWFLLRKLPKAKEIIFKSLFPDRNSSELRHELKQKVSS